MTTLSEKQAELAEAKKDLAAAGKAASYAQGDQQVTRANIKTLEIRVARLAREVRELSAAQSGATQPGVLTAKW